MSLEDPWTSMKVYSSMEAKVRKKNKHGYLEKEKRRKEEKREEKN